MAAARQKLMNANATEETTTTVTARFWPEVGICTAAKSGDGDAVAETGGRGGDDMP